MESWLFRQDKRSERLEELGNRLEFLQTLIPWEELFREDVEKVHSNVDPKLGGRPPCDALMLFKISVLQSLYNLGDKDMEYQIADRLSFQKVFGNQVRRSGSRFQYDSPFPRKVEDTSTRSHAFPAFREVSSTNRFPRQRRSNRRRDVYSCSRSA
ncbi:MAG: transposase [Planctomycetia bacterium]|nr:transposase [Planctomycetia bacterium]